MKGRHNILAGLLLLLVLLAAAGTVPVWAQVSELPSLKEIYRDYFDLGVSVTIAGWSDQTIDKHRELIAHHFNSITAGNKMKPEATQPWPGTFQFADADRMVAFAQEQGMKVRGHTLVWHSQTPQWFFRDASNHLIYTKETITEQDRQMVIDRLEKHIEAVMQHFGDAVYAWDVVNEAVSDNAGSIYRQDSPWFRILGEDYLKIAFRKAHEVNPEAKLFYNDYYIDSPAKRARTVEMLKQLLAEGVPIHGVGIQGHWKVNDTRISDIEESIRMYAELGLEIQITELDVGMTGFTEEEQAERYRELFQLFKKYTGVITSVTFWGTTDNTSWRKDESPLLFNANQEPKPAFWALVDTEKPWYVNRAEHMGAAAFIGSSGERLGVLKPGVYNAADLAPLGFTLEQVSAIELEKGYVISFYAQEDCRGQAWHFTAAGGFAGSAAASQAQSFAIRLLEPENVVLNKPVKANALAERAARAVDGDRNTSWSPSAQPPYWLEIDLEDSYLLTSWAVRLHGSGPLGGQVAESPFNAADFRLQVSEDGTNWLDADVVEGNTASVYENSLGFVPARFVRLYVTKPTSVELNTSLAVYELEVYTGGLGPSADSSTEKLQNGGQGMSGIEISQVPVEYRQALPKEQRGRLEEVSYPVSSYINRERRLVTDKDISPEEAGREVVPGEPITKQFFIYLPPGYDAEDKETQYNVLYLLHGVGGSRYEWLRGAGQAHDSYVICNILDNLIAKGEIDPLIVVFPEGRSAHDWTDTSFTPQKTNLLGFYYFDYELRHDLIPFVEANYNTYANIADDSPEAIALSRQHRAIAGLSMGGMQALNLTFGGYRHGLAEFAGSPADPRNGLAATVQTPGMQDLFAYVGAFSNAPTSSPGSVLGRGIAESPHRIELLYLTCGDADSLAIQSYRDAIEGLRDAAGDSLGAFFQVVMRGRGHDFSVWTNGFYNFIRLCFGKVVTDESVDIVLTLD